MALNDRLEKLHERSQQGTPMEKILARLDAETSDLLLKLLWNRKVSTRSIYDSLKAEGYKIGRDTIERYRHELWNLEAASQA